MSDMTKEERAEHIVKCRQANHPYRRGEGLRLVGFVVDEDTAGLSQALFALDVIKERVNSHAALQEYALEITKTLTGLSGGGSEMFDGKIGEMFKADLPRCAERIRSRHDSVHAQLVEQKKTAAALQERVRRLEEENVKLREAWLECQRRGKES